MKSDCKKFKKKEKEGLLVIHQPDSKPQKEKAIRKRMAFLNL